MGEGDAAWAAVHDPATDGATLAAIVQRHPEFGEAVLRHPQCYDGLREWIAARQRTVVAGAAGPISGATPDAAAGRTPAAANVAAPASSTATRLSRRSTLIAAIAAGVLVLGGTGVWGAVSLAGSSHPSGAEPAAAAHPTSAAPPPVTCPAMTEADGGSSGTSSTVQAAIGTSTSSADLVTTLRSVSSRAKGVATEVASLATVPQNGLDALRAVMFTSPRAVTTIRALDGQLASQCGGHLVGDLAALIADVPTMTGSRITHTDDTFGLCAPFGGGRSLGWTGTTQVFFCDKTLVSLDYARHRLSTSVISTSGEATEASTATPVLTGDHVVWTRTTEKPQSGLNQPLFSGTLVSVDATTLASPQQMTVFTDIPAPLTPEFFVLSAGNGFAVVGGRPAGSAFIGNSATAPTVLYDLRGKSAKKVDIALPPYQDGLANGTAPGLDVGLLPLWETAGVGAYVDTGTGTVVSGFTLDGFLDDGGCGRIAAGADPTASRVFDVGTGDSTMHYVIVVPTSSGLTGGKVTSLQHQSMSVVGFTAAGILFTDDSGLTLVGFDGSERWSIADTVATEKQRALGHLLMTNASGEPVVVDELTGKEITDPDDMVAQFMTSIAKGSEAGAGSFSVAQDGDRVVLNASTADGQTSLVVTRSVACPSVAVPGATTPLTQLFPH